MDEPKSLGKRFQPGKSGNPGGRPVIPVEVKELARAHTVAAIKVLADVMLDESAPHSARVRASESLLDRAWGRAEATVNVKPPSNVRDLSYDELRAAIAAARGDDAEAGEDEPGSVH